MKRIALLIVVCCWGINLQAQFVDYGSDPASIKWRQITTPHFQVIFPAENEMMAHRYALLLDSIRTAVRSTLRPKKNYRIPVVLHSYSSRMNGMVAWAPRRMELIPTHRPDFSFQPVERQLPLHESQHVVQMDKLGDKLHPLYFLFGEQLVGAGAVIVPSWFFEGDAVSTETAMSESGRGRETDFLIPYVARLQSDRKQFSFDQLSLGSYKQYTHDFYALGYVMTAYARKQYGRNVWQGVFEKMNFWSLSPFANGMQKEMGMKPKQLYDSAFQYLKYHNNSLQTADPQLVDTLTHNREHTIYSSVRVLEDGRILAIKQSEYQVTALVQIDTLNVETHLCYLGQINSSLAIAENRHLGQNGKLETTVYWTAYQRGERWAHRNYSVLQMYELSTGRQKQLSHKTRYFSPAINSDNQLLAVSEPQPDGSSQIHLLHRHSPTQNTISVAVPAHHAINHLAFDHQNNLYASVINASGNSLQHIDLSSNSWHYVLRPLRTHISGLHMDGRYLLFESGRTGVSNLFALDTLSLEVQQLSEARYGTSGGSFTPDRKNVVYAQYTADGYQIVRTRHLQNSSLNASKTANSAWRTETSFALADSISSQETFNIDQFQFAGPSPYQSTDYKKSTHLFNIHSWAPYYIDYNESRYNLDVTQSVQLGASVWSQNQLNTLTGQAAYYYNTTEKASHAMLQFEYQGWRPIIHAKLDVGGDSYIYRRYWRNDQLYLNWEQRDQKKVELNIGAYLPFVFDKGAYLQGFQIETNLDWINNFSPKQDNKTYHSQQTARVGVYYYRYLQRSVRDLMPRWGIQTWLTAGVNPLPGNPHSELFTGQVIAYLPGLLPNAGLKLNVTHQQHHLVYQRPTLYYPQNVIRRARNYTSQHFAEKSTYFSADYAFYLACPDWSLGSLLYLNRIRANAFVDHSWGHYSQSSSVDKVWAYGSDFLFDAHWFRIKAFDTSIGFRLYQTNQMGPRETKGEILFTVNLP